MPNFKGNTKDQQLVVVINNKALDAMAANPDIKGVWGNPQKNNANMTAAEAEALGKGEDGALNAVSSLYRRTVERDGKKYQSYDMYMPIDEFKSIQEASGKCASTDGTRTYYPITATAQPVYRKVDGKTQREYGNWCIKKDSIEPPKGPGSRSPFNYEKHNANCKLIADAYKEAHPKAAKEAAVIEPDMEAEVDTGVEVEVPGE